MAFLISGIQQIGVGVDNVKEAFTWYRRNFGMDVPVFEEAAEANLMLPYTGGKPHKRHAILAISMNGGSGFEIWQYTSRKPQLPDVSPRLGDLGLFGAFIKTTDIEHSHSKLTQSTDAQVSQILYAPDGSKRFTVKDPFGNFFIIVPKIDHFSATQNQLGGAVGCMIGVSNIEKSKSFYSTILGYDKVIYEQSGVFDDLSSLPGGNVAVKRCLLSHSSKRKGPFSKLLGSSQLELIQLIDGQPARIFENRYWGDLGFIHLCFDVVGMDEIQSFCEKNGHRFTVDSANSFDMGEAAGRFAYIEDPDKTLIEFVETHKIPIMKKLGWYLHLKNRNREKPLPNWILQFMSLNRVKDK